MANPVTRNFGLSLLVSSQAQKDVVVNVDLTAIDALMQANVLDVGVNIAPTLPNDQDKYIVGAAPTGVWAGQANAIAVYQANGAFWTFYPPQPGWVAFGVATASLYAWSGTAWILIATALNSLLGAIAALTPAAGSIITGNGTTWTAPASPPTLGNFLVGNGTAWASETSQQAIAPTAAMYALIFGG